MTTFRLGPYTVQQRYESDLYHIVLDGVLIGKCYSRPCESDCRWLEHQQRQKTFYAYSSAPLPEVAAPRSGQGHLRVKRRVGRPTSAKTQQDIARALAGD